MCSLNGFCFKNSKTEYNQLDAFNSVAFGAFIVHCKNSNFFIVYFSILTIWPHLPSWHTFYSIIIILFVSTRTKDNGSYIFNTQINRSIIAIAFALLPYGYCILWWNMRDALLVFFLLFSFCILSTVENIHLMMEKNKYIAQLCSMFDWTSHKPCLSFRSKINTFAWHNTHMCYASYKIFHLTIKLNPFRSNTLTPWLYFMGRPLDSPKNKQFN